VALPAEELTAMVPSLPESSHLIVIQFTGNDSAQLGVLLIIWPPLTQIFNDEAESTPTI
jgi:hypothetical protein